jgi:nitroimidazol reductase NimA-like FMN-containing flavoprotein (pyridoxamine 5'-phosphate oxidase superfamily)
MIEELTVQQIDEMLHREVIGRVACTDGKQVYVVPITYAYDGTCIFGLTRDGKKIWMIRQNPQVCFEIDHFENMVQWQSVIVQGRFEELEGSAKKEALYHIRNRTMPFLIDDAIDGESDFVTYRIIPTEKSGRRQVKL